MQMPQAMAHEVLMKPGFLSHSPLLLHDPQLASRSMQLGSTQSPLASKKPAWARREAALASALALALAFAEAAAEAAATQARAAARGGAYLIFPNALCQRVGGILRGG